MRIIGFDWGKARTGVALSDEGAVLATPLTVIVKSDPTALVAEAAALVREHGAGLAVVGCPRRSDNGAEGESAACARAFAAALNAACGIETVLCDERYSTVVAHQHYNESGKKGAQKRRQTIDSAAAAVILQSFLDHRGKTE